MKQSIFISLLYISLSFLSTIHTMDPDSYQYELDVFKHADVSDSFKIKISKTDQSGHKKSGSFIANFATHTCDDQKNLFAPFDIPMRFGDAADADSFLWDVPDFGFLKLHHEGSTFFGHSPHEIPLAADALTFHTSGELFLQTLRVAALHLGSKKTHLCEMLVADAISTEDQVFNSGSLQTSRLLGGGTFCNEGRIEFKGNQHDPALLGIKEFVNQSNERCKPTVHASHLTVRRDNQKIINKKDTEFEISEELVIDEPSAQDASLQNKGLFKAHTCDARRKIVNKGFLQANRLTARKLLENDEFGQVKILDEVYLDDLKNDGEIDAHKSINIIKGVNKGSISGSPNLTMRVHRDLENCGNIRLQQLIGGGHILNRKSLLFHDNASITIENLTNYGLLKAAAVSLIHTKLSNTVTGIVELFGKSRIGNTTILNTGKFLTQGDTDFNSATVRNRGEMAFREGRITSAANSSLGNKDTGKWLMENMKSVQPIEMDNEGMLELVDSLVDFERMRNYKEFLTRGGTPTFKKLINSGIVKTGFLRLMPDGLLQNLQNGSVEVFEKSIVDNAEIINDGDVVIQGEADFILAQIYNRNTMTLRDGTLNCTSTPLRNLNTGKWLMERIKSVKPIIMLNDGALELAESSLDFKRLKNDNDLIVHSGAYRIEDFQNKKLDLRDADWAIHDGSAPHHASQLTIIDPNLSEARLGEIRCEKYLLYDLAVMPTNLRAKNINTPKRRIWTVDQLQKLTTSRKLTASVTPESIANGDITFPNIGHLELFVNGPLTKYASLTAPILSLVVNGPLTVGKSNAELGTIAATHGPLTVTADSIDGKFAKFYGKGKTEIIATKDDVIIGSYKRGYDEAIKQQFRSGYLNSQAKLFHCNWTQSFLDGCLSVYDYSLYVPNGAYVASDDFLTLRAAKKVHINYGLSFSALGTDLIAPAEVLNHAGKVSSHGPITIESDLYTHTRAVCAHKASVTPGTNAYIEYPASGAATLESLKKITFRTKKISNYAGSIRSASSIILNGKDVLTPATGYVETPQHCYWRGIGGWANIFLLTQACTLQSGKNIQMNLGDFVVSGNWNAPGVLVFGRTGLFANSKPTRETQDVSHPRIVDVTNYMKEEARQPGFLSIGVDGAIETEFPFGVPSSPQPGDMVVLENPQYQTPLNWRNIFNPLSSINLDLHLQRLLGDFAGKVYAGNAKGNQLSTVLFGNANRLRRRHGKEEISQAELNQSNESMLLYRIAHNGLTPEQQILLYLAGQDINPYQDAGDIVADQVVIETEGDQTHLNDRVIAQGPQGVNIRSRTGDVKLETQSHTVLHGDGTGAEIEEQFACPQQQFIALQGPVNVIAHRNLQRTGTAIAAAGNVTEQAETGSFSNNPLVLQKIVTNTETKDGAFSSTTKVTTDVSHQIMPSTTFAGNQIRNQAGSSIHAVASQDVAGQSVTYQSPNTVVEGIIVADSSGTKSETKGAFSSQSSDEYKETPCAMAATLRAPQVHLIGDQARINANITAHELHDNTRDGAQFVANVKEMLYHQQTLVDSPLMSLDAGCKGGYETMIQPMLMVDRIIRVSPIGQMLFESVIIDKDRTAIIGRFVETTYHLKKWHEEWCHKDQLVSDEMLVAIAIAITIATDGMGAELIAITAENAAIAAMVNAGFSTLCATAGTAILRTGDPLQVMEQIASPQFLKSFAIDVASAGLCEKLGSALKIPMGPGAKSLMGHVQSQALKSTVDTLLNVAVNDAPVGKSLGNAAAQISLNAIAGYVSNNICGSHLNSIERKAAHSLLGGAVGFAQGGNSKGFASGAVGALTAETVGALLTADAFAVSDAAIGRLKKSDKPMTQENIQKAVQEEVAYRMKIAKIASGTVAAIAKLNPSVASQTASNTLDNDVAIRAQIYALSEMQSLLTAASRAVVNLTVHEPEQPIELSKKKRKPDEALAKTGAGKKNISKKSKPVSVSNSVRLTAEEESNIVHNLVLRRQPEAALAETGDLIMQCADEWRPHNYAKTKRSLADRIINPEKSPFIKETSEIIRAAFDHAINETINTYSWIPNPVGLACFAAETGRDIYQEHTTLGEFAFNTAATYLGLKGIQWTGRGIKKIYNYAQSKLRRSTPEGRVPFVENQNAGIWKSSEMSISGELALCDFGHYENARKIINRNPKAPFNVVAVGDFDAVAITKKGLKGLSRKNRLELERTGEVYVNAKELIPIIRNHSEYKGQHINLMACHTGSDCNGIAQQLATQMKRPISAPDGVFLGKDNGSKYGVVIGNKISSIKTFHPEERSHTKRLLPIAALPALLLSSSEPLKAQSVDTYDDLMKQYEQKPFVENPERGIWIKGCFSGDLNLHKGLERLNHQLMKYNLLDRDEKCPFVVFAHGTSSGILVGTQDIHPNGLHSVNKRALARSGEVFLNTQGVKQLIETAPGYKKGQHIHLFSCNSGSDPNGIAQQLANEMDVSVSGFTGYAGVNILSIAFASFADGSTVQSLWPELKEIKTFYPAGSSQAKQAESHNEPIQKQEQKPQRSLADRIINPEMSPFIKETSEIIRAAVDHAVNKTTDTYAMIPNPIGAACFAAETGRDLYQEKTTAGEVAFNIAATYLGLKGIQRLSRGMYQGGKRIVKGTTEGHAPFGEGSFVGSSNAMAPDTVLNKLYQGKHAAEGRVSFVDDPLAGTWSGGTISGDLVLGSDAFCTAYEQSTRYGFQIDPAAPFNVVAHGNSLLMALETKNIHSKALSQANLRVLEENGEVLFTPVQLARAIYTAPGYKKGQPIHLFSCATGAVANGFAQKLSTRMGVNVSAFTENVYNFNDKPLFNVYCEATGKIGVVKTFYPQSGVSKAVASSLLLAGCSEENSSSSSSSEQIERAGAQPMINHTDTHPVKTYNDLMKEYVQQKPFVDDPKRGWWPKACISSNLILLNKNEKSINMNISKSWDRDARCPFNVTAHGGRFHVQIDTQDIHSDGLSTAYKDVLKIQGNVNLNAQELAHLIRTAPGYKEGQNVNLYACNCGAHPNGIAQQLADELRVTVTAFPDRVSGFYNQQLDTSYFISVSKDDDSHFKEIKTFYPRDPGQSRISNIPDRFGEHFN